MGIVAKRIWRAVGPVGFAQTIVAVILVYKIISGPSWETADQGVRTLVLIPVALAILGYRLLRYRRPRATITYDEALDHLSSSNEQFCLSLRPFGKDGETLLRLRRRTNVILRLLSYMPYQNYLTIEEVIAHSAQQALDRKTYALVDQSRTVAPPGPVYVRAPNADWQAAILPFIQHAASIVIWLTPEQTLRDAFNWEIEQIVHYGMQHRTIIVLPPPDQGAESYRRSVEQAGLLVATMQTASGRSAEASNDSVSKYVAYLGENTIAIRLQPAEHGNGKMLMRWSIQYPRRPWPIRKLQVDASLYEGGLVEFLTDIEKDSVSR
ncbi:MAG TPA: hypothetical protein VGI96_40020 [Streptosporangiaceae bacterium]|jgi:hypothetical protein